MDTLLLFRISLKLLAFSLTCSIITGNILSTVTELGAVYGDADPKMRGECVGGIWFRVHAALIGIYTGRWHIE